MSDKQYKLQCDQCGWRGTGEERLKAPNPFDDNDTCYGCPECKTINECSLRCDEGGCWELASCGTPTKDGYKHTCSKHKPELLES